VGGFLAPAQRAASRAATRGRSARGARCRERGGSARGDRQALAETVERGGRVDGAAPRTRPVGSRRCRGRAERGAQCAQECGGTGCGHTGRHGAPRDTAAGRWHVRQETGGLPNLRRRRAACLRFRPRARAPPQYSLTTPAAGGFGADQRAVCAAGGGAVQALLPGTPREGCPSIWSRLLIDEWPSLAPP